MLYAVQNTAQSSQSYLGDMPQWRWRNTRGSVTIAEPVAPLPKVVPQLVVFRHRYLLKKFQELFETCALALLSERQRVAE